MNTMPTPEEVHEKMSRTALPDDAPFHRLFSPGRLTFGLITPFEAYPIPPYRR